MTGFTGYVDNLQSSEDDNNSPSPEEFEMCGASAINIDDLPDPARTEVETALEDGQYETDEELYLPHLIDIGTSSLIPGSWRYRGVAYRAVVTQDETTTTLELEQTVPSHGEEPLEIHNNTDQQLTVEIQITGRGETVLEETVTIEPDTEIETAAFDRQFGSYTLTVSTDSEGEYELGWTEQNDRIPLSEVGLDADELLEVPRPYIHPEECASWAPGQAEPEPEPEPESEPEDQPGFGIASTLTALGGFGYLLKQRLTDNTVEGE